jgi:hypothetical protein
MIDLLIDARRAKYGFYKACALYVSLVKLTFLGVVTAVGICVICALIAVLVAYIVGYEGPQPTPSPTQLLPRPRIYIGVTAHWLLKSKT